MNIFYAVNAIGKIHQHIKPSTAKVYQYLRKLDKNLEEAHLKSTLESFIKNGYLVVPEEAEDESVFSVKSFEDILEYFKQSTPQENTRTEITELEHFFDSAEKSTHSEKNSSQANDNYGILYERMITDLKCEMKFLRDQIASRDIYFHEEIKFLRQQLETALSKQENSNIGFCNNRHGQHIPSNIVNSDDSFITRDYNIKTTGSDNNVQAVSYINNDNTDNIAPPSTENSQKDHMSSHISTPTSSVNKKKIFILGDSMVKHMQGWYISNKLHNKHKVYVCSFSSAKVKFKKDYSKPCIKEDKPDYLILHVGTNDLSSENTAERIEKSTADLAKGMVADDRTISVSSIVPRNDKLNSKAAEVNSYLERMYSNVIYTLLIMRDSLIQRSI